MFFTAHAFNLDTGGSSEVKSAIATGDSALKVDNWTLALEKFREAVASLVGIDTKVPMDANDGGGFYRDLYVNLSVRKKIEMQSCCRGMGAALAGMGRYSEVRLNTIEGITTPLVMVRLTHRCYRP